MVKIRERKSFAPAKLALSVAVALAAMAAAPASAFVLWENSEDAAILRLDTTVRYNLGWRMSEVDNLYAMSYNADETETVFKKHDLITNRLDVLVESDYQAKWDNGLNYGARVSGAVWSENAYPSHSKTNPEIGNAWTSAMTQAYGPVMGPVIGPMLTPGSNYDPSSQKAKWSRYAKRYVTGTSGELLDAFVFSGFKLGDTNLNVKLGKHTVYWGESMWNEGVSFAQSPLNGIKGATVPGSELKEIFMPINQFSANWQLSPEWAILANYQLEWQPIRNLAAGTFFGADNNGDLKGADPFCGQVAPSPDPGNLPTTCLRNLDSVMPDKHGGSYGLGVRWNPTWMDSGSLGFYYRKLDETQPWGSVQMSSDPAEYLPGIRYSFARDTELFGITASRNFGPVNGAIELVYRKNTALKSRIFVDGSQGGNLGYSFSSLNITPSYEQMEGARGNTMHLIMNAVKLLDNTGFYEAGTVAVELAYQRLDKVTKNKYIYNAEGYACKPANANYPAQNKGDGCATKDSLRVNISFEPQWLGALPSVDLTAPISFGLGVFGNSPASQGGSREGQYSWSIGLTGVYRGLYEFGIQYAGSHANMKKESRPSVATGGDAPPGYAYEYTHNGDANLNSHRWLGLNFKTSF